MLHGKKIIVVMPAYNAEKTLEQTYHDVPKDIVDEIILVDDCSKDSTVELAQTLAIHTVLHFRNTGYGGNQKTCYATALAHGADIVVMVHPDYQYDPRLLYAMCSMISLEIYDAVLASRILMGSARHDGMPFWRYFSNRFLTFVQNILQGAKLSEYHTGYRAYARKVLTGVDFHANSDNFLFDNQILSQILMEGFRVGEVSCPTRYFPEASSINFGQSVRYGLGVLGVSVLFRLHRWGIHHSSLFAAPEKR